MEKISISQAIKQICDEKGIAYEAVLETIESALAAAYRKDFGNKLQNIKVEFDPETTEIKAFDVKTVVEDVPEEELAEVTKLSETVSAKPSETIEHVLLRRILRSGKTKQKDDKEEKQDQKDVEKKDVGAKKEVGDKDKEAAQDIKGAETDKVVDEKPRFNPRTMIQISEAKKIDKKYKLGAEIVTPLPVPGAFGRMAAQTAKQVIIQKLREAERETLYHEFKEKQGLVLVGTVQRREGRVILMDLGRATAIMLPEGQISNEVYSPGQHLKVYLESVAQTTKGPEIIISRSHENVVRKLFETEIPEIANGLVVIKGLAREAGARTKIAVHTDDENIDPIGSCIGQRGARVQTIIAELKGEKIDIIQYNDNPAKYISNALSPAKIADIKIDEKNRLATVMVAEDQLSLAIGRGGQNVRLASQLTGWKIDMRAAGDKGPGTEKTETTANAKTPPVAKTQKDADKADASEEGAKEKAGDKKESGVTEKVAAKKEDNVKKEVVEKKEAGDKKEAGANKKDDGNKKVDTQKKSQPSKT